jgi:hypothetical protein
MSDSALTTFATVGNMRRTPGRAVEVSYALLRLELGSSAS